MWVVAQHKVAVWWRIRTVRYRHVPVKLVPMHTDALGKGLDPPVTLKIMATTALAISPTAALFNPGNALFCGGDGISVHWLSYT